MENSVDKVPIELTPYEALNLLRFLREFDYNHHPKLKALGNCVDSFELEVSTKIRNDQVDDAISEREVNKLMDFEPS